MVKYECNQPFKTQFMIHQECFFPLKFDLFETWDAAYLGVQLIDWCLTYCGLNQLLFSIPSESAVQKLDCCSTCTSCFLGNWYGCKVIDDIVKCCTFLDTLF